MLKRIFVALLCLNFMLADKAIAGPFDQVTEFIAASSTSVYVLQNGGRGLVKLNPADLTVVQEVELNERGRAIQVSDDIPLVLSQSRGELVISSFDPATLEKTGEAEINIKGNKKGKNKNKDEDDDSVSGDDDDSVSGDDDSLSGDDDSVSGDDDSQSSDDNSQNDSQ